MFISDLCPIIAMSITVSQSLLLRVAWCDPGVWGCVSCRGSFYGEVILYQDFKKYIIPGEPIVRISLATLAFHPHFAMVSRRSSQVRDPSVISSSWSHKPVVCLSLLGGEGGDRQPGVNFYRFNAKNWQFTVYFAVITQKIGNLLCILS